MQVLFLNTCNHVAFNLKNSFWPLPAFFGGRGVRLLGCPTEVEKCA